MSETLNETAPPTCQECGETCGDHAIGCPNETRVYTDYHDHNNGSD
jgi:hypothetical protein